MTTCDTGDVVLVQFPFTDLAATKQRPAVVISPAGFRLRYGDCVLVPLTGQSQSNSALALTQWKQSGLLKPTSGFGRSWRRSPSGCSSG
jgi:mRNA interferase MazF